MTVLQVLQHPLEEAASEVNRVARRDGGRGGFFLEENVRFCYLLWADAIGSLPNLLFYIASQTFRHMRK